MFGQSSRGCSGSQRMGDIHKDHDGVIMEIAVRLRAQVTLQVQNQQLSLYQARCGTNIQTIHGQPPGR